MEYTDYLAHYGILGMRWGIRRFQNRDGSLTAAGRKRAGVGEKTRNARHKPSSAKKLAKQRAAALEKARQAKAAKKEYETNKKEALAKGSAADVLKFKGDLSQQELQSALNRINLEKQLTSIAASDIKSAWDAVNSVTDKMGRMVNLTSKGIEAWNIFAKISNSFSEDKLPVIGGDNKKEDPEAKIKDKALADYAAKNGNLDQVLKYASNMNASEFKSALDRLKPKDEGPTKERDKVIADYAAKNGTFDQVVKYAPQMSTETLSDALTRFVPKDPDVSEATRQKMVRDLIIDFGSTKNIMGIAKDLSADEVTRARQALEKAREEEKNKNKSKKDEDDDS